MMIFIFFVSRRGYLLSWSRSWKRRMEEVWYSCCKDCEDILIREVQ